MERRLFSPNICWILGAGASYDCLGTGEPCLPLTRDLLAGKDLSPDILNQFQHLKDQGLAFIDDGYGGLGAGLEDTIDRLRGLCDFNSEFAVLAAECLKGITHEISIQLTRNQLPIISGNAELTNYLWLSRGCCVFPNWSVLTLNWDILLDYAFETWEQVEGLSAPEQYSSWWNCLQVLANQDCTMDKEDTPPSYIKLHGSLGLFSCHNLKCPSYRIPFMDRPERRPGLDRAALSAFYFTVKPHSFANCPSCGEAAEELILPPGKNKTQAEGLYQDMAYGISERLLGRADIWIILGYSCPDYDEDVAKLLARALKRAPLNAHDRWIWVVSPDAEETCRRLGKAFGYSGDAPVEVSDLGVETVYLGTISETFTSFVHYIRAVMENRKSRKEDIP